MKSLVFTLFFTFCIQVNATQQIPEEFDVDMAKFDIEQQPLDSFIDNQQFQKKFGAAMCSASWRGYKGYWALRGEQLMLTRLVTDACSKSPNSVDPEELFKKKKYPIEATWYSGRVVVRISKRNFFDADRVGYSGQIYEAVVYVFLAGKLISRSIEIVEERWQ